VRDLQFNHRIRAVDERRVVHALTSATRLESLSLRTFKWSSQNLAACLNAVAQNQRLTYLSVCLPANGMCGALCATLTSMTRLASLSVLFDGVPDATHDTTAILNVLKHNYSLIDGRVLFRWSHMSAVQGFDIALNDISTRNRSLLWRHMHSVLLELMIAALPLELPVYILLWVFDWLQPMSHNPHLHVLRKVRLIEGLQRSRSTIIAMRSVVNAHGEQRLGSNQLQHRRRCIIV